MEGDRLTLGKASSNDLPIESDPTVSRLHAVLERFPSGWSIRDLSSRNGTFVNGDRVFADRPLLSGDELLIGRTRLVYKLDAPEDRTATEIAEGPPELSVAEASVLLALCRPLLSGDVFTEPATTDQIAADAGLASAETERHLRSLAVKFGVEGSGERMRARLANEGIRRGAVTLADLRRGEPRAAPASPERRGSLHREGEYWTVEHEGRVVRLRDTKGLHYLARLLAEPGRELHALDLVSTGVEATGDPAALAEAGMHAGTLGDAGAVLDPQAKAEYRRRLEDLDHDMEEAEAYNDPERAARARAEREFIARELAAAVGLGGRDRKAVSASERARVNVTRAIKSAIERIAEQDDALGRHLSATVRTGTFCSYAPTPGGPTSWSL